MILPSGRMQLNYSDSDINKRTRKGAPAASPSTRHFSQNEEFFVRLPQPVEVESFPVHHELGNAKPHARQRAAVRSLVEQLMEVEPALLHGLTHLFDPSANQLPAFFRLYRMGGLTYLYLMRIDLTYRPRRSQLITRTSSAETTHYATTDLFLESDLFPLESVEARGDKIQSIQLEQSVSDTWIGETGRGYMRAGMWLDRDLTKFFSRLFVPQGVHTYPYFPFSCKYRAISHSVIAVEDEKRQRSVRLLAGARDVLLPRLREIEESLRNVAENGFAEDLETFAEMKRTIGPEWDEPWKDFAIHTYLNEEDEREFQIDHGLF